MFEGLNIVSILITVLGLCLFESITSLDNAVINAEVLATMSARARRWFLLWGILFAVVVVRGLLPWLIVWIATPSFGPLDAITATFSNDPKVKEAIDQSAPVLLVGGGIFLLFIFFHWLFLEPKEYGLRGERFIHAIGIWFYAVASVILTVIVWFSIKTSPYMAFGAVVGSSAFFITHGFKQNAAAQEERLVSGKSGLSDVSKIAYLEVLDASFSIDGVLGAFAFTFSVPLILLGNGLGAIVLRQLTVANISRIKKYIYLKNGAMYAIFCLGLIMLLESFGVHIPSWVSPVTTFVVIGYFFWKSWRAFHRHPKEKGKKAEDEGNHLLQNE